MKNNLYYIGITSLTDFLLTHDKNSALYYSIGKEKIKNHHGITREKWMVIFSDVQNGTCRYYAQAIGYTDKINGEPFDLKSYNQVLKRAEDLRAQIKQRLGFKQFDLCEGGISFPKDLILIEANNIEYDKETNRFKFKF